MNQRMQWVWAAAMLMLPLAASAQAPKADPGAAPPAVAPAPPAPDDDGSWLADLFSMSDPIESAFATADPAPIAMGDLADAEDGPGAMAFDDEGDGPGDPQRHGQHMHMREPGGRGAMMRRGLGMRFAALDLTDAQRQKLRDIHEAAARKNVQRRADMQLARMDLQKLMRAETPSASAVNAQIDKLSRLQADGMKAHFDTFMQARALLTPEQLKKLHSGPPAMEHEHEGHGND